MPKTFKLGCRSKGSAIIKAETAITFDITDPPPAKFTFQTSTLPFGGGKLPGDLIVIAEGDEESLDAAASRYASAAAILTQVLALGANAYFSQLEVEVVAETTATSKKREFFQRLVQAGPPVLTARFVNAEATIALWQAVLAHPHSQTMVIAINQYVLALSYWGMREDLLVLSHLFMCAETLKAPMLDHVLKVERVSEEELGKRWNWPGKGKRSRFLLWQCRERELFQGDAAVLEPATDISHAFEHGYANWNQSHAKAAEIVGTMARYMRDAILRVLKLREETLGVLQSDLYKNPMGPVPIEFRLNAIIEGKGSMAPDGLHLPKLAWSQSIDKIKIQDGRFSFTTSTKVEGKLPDGLKLTELKITVEAPEAFDFQPSDGFLEAEAMQGPPTPDE